MIYRDWIAEIEAINPRFFDQLRDCSHRYMDEDNVHHLEHGGNVYGHTMDVYEQARQRYQDDEILQLGCLLHDIAKPHCRELIPEKRKTSFFNHENFGVSVAMDILPKLNLTDRDIVRVLELIQRHADSYKLGLKKLKAWYDQASFEDTLKIRWCDTVGRTKLDDDGSDLEQIREMEDKLIEFKESFDHTKPGLPTVTVLIGPPGSGKTSFLAKRNESVLSRDAIVMELGKSADYNKNWYSVPSRKVDSVLSNHLQKLISLGENFTIDMTNMNVKARNKYLSELGKNYNLHAVVFLVGYEELLRRNKTREDKTLKVSVINSMLKRWQLPLPGEGFSEVNYQVG